uniref:Uncharacterized protein n=1 Tax=Meloidogyne incognita TaxID=6306 RepID=A0A914NGA2_MELIC
MRCQPFRGKYQQESLYPNPSSISQNGKYSAGSSFVSDNIYNYGGGGEKEDEKMDDDDGWLSKDTQILNNKSANSSSSPFNNQKSLSPAMDSLLEKSKNFNEKIFENNYVEEKDNDTDTEPGEIPTDFDETNKLNNGELSFFENDGPDNLDKDIIWLIGGGKRVESSKTGVGNYKNINKNNLVEGRIEEHECLEEVDSWFSKDCQNKSQTLEDNLNSQNIGRKQIKEKEKQKEIILLDDKEEEDSVELISNDGTEPADILILNNFIEEIDNSVGNGQKEHDRMEEIDSWFSKEDYQNESQTLESNLNSKNIEEQPKHVEEKEINEKEDEIMEEEEDEGWLSKDSGQSLSGKSKKLIEEASKSIENPFSPLKNFIQQFEQQEQSQKTKKLIEDSDFLIIEKPMSIKNFIIQQEEQTKINEKINETPILNNKEDENKDDDDILTEPGEIPPSDCETEPGEIPPSDNESFGSTEPGELPLSDFEEEEKGEEGKEGKINNSNLNNDWIIENDERRENNTKCSETVIIIRMGIL